MKEIISILKSANMTKQEVAPGFSVNTSGSSSDADSDDAGCFNTQMHTLAQPRISTLSFAAL
jgi:hypothetical protein